MLFHTWEAALANTHMLSPVLTSKMCSVNQKPSLSQKKYKGREKTSLHYEYVMSPRSLTVTLHFKHKMCGHFVFHETFVGFNLEAPPVCPGLLIMLHKSSIMIILSCWWLVLASLHDYSWLHLFGNNASSCLNHTNYPASWFRHHMNYTINQSSKMD